MRQSFLTMWVGYTAIFLKSILIAQLIYQSTDHAELSFKSCKNRKRQISHHLQ